MSLKLPQRTIFQDINKIVEVLGPKIMGMRLDEARKIDTNLFVDTNISTCDFLGLIELQGENIKLASAGRSYYKSASESEKRSVLRERLRQIPIYDRTIEYFHHNESQKPTKVDIASYWHDNFSDSLEGIDEESLANAAIFFIRFLEMADLGKYVQAGRGRETHAILDRVKIAEYITSDEATPETIQKYEKEIAKEAEAEQQKTDEIPLLTSDIGAALSGSNIRAIAKLQRELTDKDLDSPGAKKLLIDMLDRLEKENTVLKAKVDSSQDVEISAAILKTQVQTLSRQNLLKTSVNSIGGIILGASFSLTELLQKIVFGVLGLVLIIVSIFLRERKQDELSNENLLSS